MNSYGKSWKTPALDTKMKNIHGGQTMQRFYTKFPFYRERGHSPPNVEDDLEQVLKETLAMPTQKHVRIRNGARSVTASQKGKSVIFTSGLNQDAVPV